VPTGWSFAGDAHQASGFTKELKVERILVSNENVERVPTPLLYRGSDRLA